MRNKFLMTGLIVGTILGTGLFVAQQISAKDSTQNPMSSLVQKIATKFNLQTSDVQAIFDQDRTEREAQMQTEYEATLTKAVTDGKITEAQKQLIIAKNKELETARQTNMDQMKNMTEDQRKTAMDAERTSLEDWLKQNGIDRQYMQSGRGGMHGPEGMGEPPNGKPFASPAAQ